MPTDYFKQVTEPAKTNPFVPELIKTAPIRDKTRTIKTKKGFISTSMGMHDPATGEILDGSMVIATKSPLDREGFVKMFARGITQSFDLSKRGQELLRVLLILYMSSKLPSAVNDQIIFSFEDALAADYPRKRPTFKSALNELCYYQFLCPVANHRDRYWINANLFYKGDRLTLINHYVTGEAAAEPINSQRPTGDPELDQMGFDGLTERERRANNAD